MRLYVMRHGPAEDRAPTGRDFDRALTRAGREVVAPGGPRRSEGARRGAAPPALEPVPARPRDRGGRRRR